MGGLRTLNCGYVKHDSFVGDCSRNLCSLGGLVSEPQCSIADMKGRKEAILPTVAIGNKSEGEEEVSMGQASLSRLLLLQPGHSPPTANLRGAGFW